MLQVFVCSIERSKLEKKNVFEVKLAVKKCVLCSIIASRDIKEETLQAW